MARLIWTEPALLNLDEIVEYIAFDIPLAASRYVRSLRRVCEGRASGKTVSTALCAKSLLRSLRNDNL